MQLSHLEQETIIKALLAYKQPPEMIDDPFNLGEDFLKKFNPDEQEKQSLSGDKYAYTPERQPAFVDAAIVVRFLINSYRDSRADVTKTEHHWQVSDPKTGLFEDGEAIGLAVTEAKEASIAKLLARVKEHTSG